MRSKQEFIAAFFFDIIKSIFVGMVLGKLLNPSLIPDFVIFCGIIILSLLTCLAYGLYPDTVVRKES